MGRVAAGTQCIDGQIVYDTGSASARRFELSLTPPVFVNSKQRRSLQVRRQSSSNGPSLRLPLPPLTAHAGRLVRVMHKRQTH